MRIGDGKCMASIKYLDINGSMDTTNCKVSGNTLKLISRKEEYWGKVWNWPPCSSDSCHNGGGHDVSCLPSNYSDNEFCWDIDTLPFHFTYRSFLASDYVLLNAGTTIDAYSNIYINILDCDTDFYRSINEYIKGDEYYEVPPASFIDKMTYHY